MDELESSVIAEEGQTELDQSEVVDTGVKDAGVAEPKPQQDNDNAAWKRARLAEEKNNRAEARAKKLGYSSFDEMEAELEKRDQEELYAQVGVQDPKVIEQIINNHPSMRQANQLINNARIAEEKEALKSQKYFKELEPLINATLQQNPSLNVADVFKFIRGAEMDKLIEKETKTAANKAVDDHLNQAKRITEPSDSSAIDEKNIDFTAEEKIWAERGVQRGTYKNLTEAHKWLRGK